MAEEDCCIDTAIEPRVSLPKDSLIDMEVITPRNRTNPYKNLSITKIIGQGKFPVFLATSRNTNQDFALKLFPCKNPNSVKCYQNEILFASLNHTNILKILHFEQNKTVKYQNNTSSASLIISEYAPYGDFFDFVLKHKANINEKLIRTYFRQLIQGLGYLQKRGISHLDLKLENLLIGENFNLKIADFDLSLFSKNSKVLTKGTEYYRAPELLNGKCENGSAADIYSTGVILFTLKSGGIIPHTESAPFKGIDFLDLLNNNPSKFWRRHCEIQQKQMSEFSMDFRDLVIGMLKSDPEERWTLQKIKESRWYNDVVYSEDELHDVMKRLLQT